MMFTRQFSILHGDWTPGAISVRFSDPRIRGISVNEVVDSQPTQGRTAARRSLDLISAYFQIINCYLIEKREGMSRIRRAEALR